MAENIDNDEEDPNGSMGPEGQGSLETSTLLEILDFHFFPSQARNWFNSDFETETLFGFL